MKMIEQLKALADANRLRAVQALLVHEELCACQFTEWLGVTGATVSRHLAQLQNAGLVQASKEGRWVHFRLSPDFPAELREWIQRGLQKEDRIRLAAVIRQNPADLCRKQRQDRARPARQHSKPQKHT